MGTKYTSQSASGYNSTPPTDDGTQSDANKVKWSTIKDKLTDPAKTLADNINTQVNTALDYGPVSVDSAAVTLGTSHNNQFIELSGAATPTLDSSDGLGAGWFCDVKNVGTQAITMARERTNDTIDGVTADVTLNPLDYIRFVVNAAANGFYTVGIKKATAAQVQAGTASDVFITPENFKPGTGALCYVSSAATISDNVNYIVAFDGEAYDDLSLHSAGDSRLTVPSGTKRVRLYANIALGTASAGTYQIAIFKNGSSNYPGGPIIDTATTTTAPTRWNLSTSPLDVSGGEYFEVNVIQVTGSNNTIATGNTSWFAMEIIK